MTPVGSVAEHSHRGGGRCMSSPLAAGPPSGCLAGSCCISWIARAQTSSWTGAVVVLVLLLQTFISSRLIVHNVERESVGAEAYCTVYATRLRTTRTGRNPSWVEAASRVWYVYKKKILKGVCWLVWECSTQRFDLQLKPTSRDACITKYKVSCGKKVRKIAVSWTVGSKTEMHEEISGKKDRNIAKMMTYWTEMRNKQDFFFFTAYFLSFQEEMVTKKKVTWTHLGCG